MGSVKEPTDEQNKVEQLSDDQLKKLAKKRMDFMKEHIEELELEARYTKAKADIKENIYREKVYQLKYAELVTDTMPEPSNEGSDTDQKKKS